MGPLKNVRLVRRFAPRNERKRVFQVIASGSKNSAAILKCSFGPFSTAPLSLVFSWFSSGLAGEVIVRNRGFRDFRS